MASIHHFMRESRRKSWQRQVAAPLPVASPDATAAARICVSCQSSRGSCHWSFLAAARVHGSCQGFSHCFCCLLGKNYTVLSGVRWCFLFLFVFLRIMQSSHNCIIIIIIIKIHFYVSAARVHARSHDRLSPFLL